MNFDDQFVHSSNSNKRDPEERNLFLCCVSDLAIECRDYDLLFGKMQRNGIRSRGLIDQFESIEVDPRKACEMVADELVKKGLFEDAIKLFDLAGVSILNYFYRKSFLKRTSQFITD